MRKGLGLGSDVSCNVDRWVGKDEPGQPAPSPRRPRPHRTQSQKHVHVCACPHHTNITHSCMVTLALVWASAGMVMRRRALRSTCKQAALRIERHAAGCHRLPEPRPRKHEPALSHGGRGGAGWFGRCRPCSGPRCGTTTAPPWRWASCSCGGASLDVAAVARWRPAAGGPARMGGAVPAARPRGAGGLNSRGGPGVDAQLGALAGGAEEHLGLAAPVN